MRASRPFFCRCAGNQDKDTEAAFDRIEAGGRGRGKPLGKGTVENLLPAPAINVAASEVGSPKVATTTPLLSPAVNKKSPSSVEVPLKEDSGIFVVPVEINGAITLDFAVDRRRR